jgi:hypothetical protein
MIDKDRLNHSLAVAKKMVEIGRGYNLTDEQLQKLFLLGYNHDIGYEFGNNENHRIVGGNILKASNYQYWQEVYYHGEIDIEYNSMYLDILNQADMQIDKYGNDVGYDKRLEDIKSRYGDTLNIYNKAKLLIEKLRKEE